MFLAVFVLAAFNPHWLDVIISPYSEWWVVALRIAYLAYSLVLCCLLLAMFGFKANWHGNIISRLGSDTLFFYLAHPYVLYAFVCLWTLFDGRVNIFDTFVITALTVAFLSLMERVQGYISTSIRNGIKI